MFKEHTHFNTKIKRQRHHIHCLKPGNTAADAWNQSGNHALVNIEEDEDLDELDTNEVVIYNE